MSARPLPWQGETEGAGPTRAFLTTEGSALGWSLHALLLPTCPSGGLIALILLGLCITTVYSCPGFRVFLKLILSLFSEVGSCYAAHAGFPRAGITRMLTNLFLPKLLM